MQQQSAAAAAFSSIAAAPEPRIRVRGLGKHYGALEVFRSIDFDVGAREIVAIVGPSGCGKTTLLRCIDGLLPHDAGEIMVGNQRVTEPIAGVAMVFQHFGLFPWKTVFDNVAYGLRMAGAPKAEIERKVPEFIKLVGLSGFEKAFPYQMSGGMQQRWLRTLNIEHHQILAGTDGSMAPGFETEDALKQSKMAQDYWAKIAPKPSSEAAE